MSRDLFRTRLPNRSHLFEELLSRMRGRGWFTAMQFAYVLYLGRKLHCQQKSRVAEKLQELTQSGRLDMHIDIDGLYWFNNPPEVEEMPASESEGDSNASQSSGASGGGRLSVSDQLTLRLIDFKRDALMPGRRRPSYEPAVAHLVKPETRTSKPWSDWHI